MTTDDPSDADLWARAAAGSGSAFATLFDRHAKAVYNHCFRLTASWSAAEDLAQSTFLHAWRKRNAVHLEHDSALPWLLGWPPTRNHRRGLGRWLRSPSGCPPNRWPPTTRTTSRRGSTTSG